MIPGDPLQTEQGGPGTDANDGAAVVQDTHQSGMCSRIELDADDGEPPSAGRDERRDIAGHLNGFVDEQRIDRLRIAAASRGRGICADTGGARHRREGQASTENNSSGYHVHHCEGVR